MAEVKISVDCKSYGYNKIVSCNKENLNYQVLI